MDKVVNQLQVDISSEGFVDEGDGVVRFPNGLTITDGSEQRNGTKYDIESLNINKYGGHLTGDHVDSLGNLIGETQGVVKKNGAVVVNKIRYAVKENPYARLAYNLLVGGFSKNFSTETIGPPPDEAGVYWNAELVGLSQVVTQNNYNAKVNQLIHNSLEQSKNDGLDVNGIEQKVLNNIEEQNMDKTKTEETKVENDAVEEQVEATEAEVKEEPTTEESTVEETKTEAPVEEAKTEETPEETSETEEEAPAEAEATEETETAEESEKHEESLSEDKKETNNKETEMAKEDTKTVENSLTAEGVAEIVANALKPIAEEMASVKEAQQNAFDASAKEPEFKKEENEVEEKSTNAFASMDWQERYNEQVKAAWNAVKMNNVESWQTLRQINEVNLNELKEKGIAKNAISLDDLGNFVISPELYDEIVGHRNDYTSILNETEWKETMSLEFAWLKRTGDIDMQNVAIGYDGDGTDDDRLKPVSEYTATPQTSKLEELAAVTVVATSATRFAAVDLLSDAAQGYRNDYDRKRAQLVIAKLEQAIDTNGKSVGYDTSTYDGGDAVGALTVWLDAMTEISDTTLNGTLVFTNKTYSEIRKRALQAGANGPWAEILQSGDVPMIFGMRYVVVPNDLMPSLGGSESISHSVEGSAVPINHAVYFADLSTFTGRTSGGLVYDVSNSAAYESGGNVKSAYQRNELVLRGSFFRGGAIKDTDVVAGVRQDNTANVS